jgi:hypothetical protein
MIVSLHRSECGDGLAPDRSASTPSRLGEATQRDFGDATLRDGRSPLGDLIADKRLDGPPEQDESPREPEERSHKYLSYKVRLKVCAPQPEREITYAHCKQFYATSL